METAGKMKPKLGLVISNLQGGGAQRVASTLSFGLAEYYDLSLILHDGQKIGYPYRGQVVDLKTPATANPILRLINFFIRIYRLKGFKKSFRPQAVISFMEGSNFINLLSGGAGKVIISVRNYKSRQKSGFIGQLFAFLIKLLYGRSDLIVAASEGIKADLVDSFSLPVDKIKVIYNPYDLDYIAEKSKESLAADERAYFEQGEVLVTAGNLSSQKGQWHLVRALSKVRKSKPGVKLVVLGEGELHQYLTELVAALQLEEAVMFTGYRENPFKYMRGADLFILPSLYEGFPNVLVEAMACETAVVAADCPSGPREILAPQTAFSHVTMDVEEAEYGVLIPPCSGQLAGAEESLSREEQLMAEAMVNLLGDQERVNYYRDNSKKRASDFAARRIINDWLEILK